MLQSDNQRQQASFEVNYFRLNVCRGSVREHRHSMQTDAFKLFFLSFCFSFTCFAAWEGSNKVQIGYSFLTGFQIEICLAGKMMHRCSLREMFSHTCISFILLHILICIFLVRQQQWPHFHTMLTLSKVAVDQYFLLAERGKRFLKIFLLKPGEGEKNLFGKCIFQTIDKNLFKRNCQRKFSRSSDCAENASHPSPFPLPVGEWNWCQIYV